MEKRANTRVLFNVKALIKHGKKTIEGRIINLSLKGILIDTPERIPANTVVEVEILMEGASSELTVGLEARVVRSDDTGTALIFRSVDIDSFIHLRNIVAYNEGDEQKIMNEFFDSLDHNNNKTA